MNLKEHQGMRTLTVGTVMMVTGVLTFRQAAMSVEHLPIAFAAAVVAACGVTLGILGVIWSG